MSEWRHAPFALLVGALVLMWGVEIVDSVALGDRLQSGGIRPRRADGIDGIAFAPFLHSGWSHIASNSVPFLVLGGLVGIRGRRRLVTTTLIIAVIGGLLTWLFAGSGNHIGASGVVFGYFGALLGAALFERKLATLAAALVAILLYSSILVGVVPQEGISWEGHLFGVIAGIVAAKVLAEPVRRPWDDDPDFDENDPFPDVPGFDQFGTPEY